MSIVKLLGVIGGGTLLCLLVACSSAGRNFAESTMQETLDVEILPNTSKMFVYRLRWPEDQIPRLVQVARVGTNDDQSSRAGINVGSGTEKRLQDNAAYVVKHMGYCRNGFMKIDSRTSRYHLWLKGECKEGATEADRQQFGEKQTLPVKIVAQ